MIGRATRFLALVALAACSNAANEDDVFVKALNLGGDKVVPRAQALYDAGAPRIVIGIPKTDRSAIMVLEARRDGLETWLSADGAAVILDRGLLRGTRGLGAGLLASDVSQSAALVLAGREGRATRFHTFLTGTDETVTRTYECRVEDRGARTVELGSRQVSTRLMAESCNSTDQQFVNLYWVDDGDGRIVLSRQWTGDYLGDISLRAGDSRS
ncbi:YjbF family lipoprotein [Jhaorihella thermophila]|uniref:Group 4 capsule polysaccharide lipoprotein gfcB, YjbF n=1 Tax=Jhaorihella thermophila TaxID=488547 RepID=A0A1H5YLG8_9RHOB|nr:YjbF family lipoprotein [Jhaorihella thermophila]SEG24580.1 Group 4 capsule polysaccharide lipoprotein gfcB, YjbF [Jhaorihella thermophila]